MRALLSNFGTTLALLCLAASPFVHGQEISVAPPEIAKLTFDVATIRPARTPSPEDPCSLHTTPSGQEYLGRCMTLRLMIAFLYKIPSRQITGAPAWFDSETFDIQGKAEKPSNTDELHAMLQNLLAERFALKFHTEVKQGNIYALTIGSGGLKMTVNNDPDDFKIPVTGEADGLRGKRVPINYLCWQLGQFLRDDERPVINMTGLTGNYDYKLTFAPPLPPDYDKDTLPPGFLDRPNLYDAIRLQLGLKLTPQKGPVTYMVIDHIEKPSEN